MTIWKMRADYHNALARLALAMLKRIDKERNPRQHKCVDGMWNYHMNKSAKILQDHLRKKMKGL